MMSDWRMILRGDNTYPRSLLWSPYAVDTLWVRGEGSLAEATERGVAIVGARASTAYGDETATHLAAGLAERRMTVVSGGAYGIDKAAHLGALAAGGRTVIVLACGVDVVYPRAHDTLFGRVLESGGLIVSQFAPGERPQRSRFLERNRTLVALCQGTVVVEAADRSGSMAAARATEQVRRPLMAVPGPVTSVMSEATNRLIRERRARLVTDASDVLETIALESPSWL